MTNEEEIMRNLENLGDGVSLADYQRPSIDIFERYDEDVNCSAEEINQNKSILRQLLDKLGIKIAEIKVATGPAFTLYEIVPAQGISMSRIKTLEADIAVALNVLGVRIIAPVAGKNTIGVEIPNHTRHTVSMRSVVESEKFQDCKYELPVALGRTVQNEPFIIDLAQMPNLLIAGATGQGKSVGLNVIINSLIYKKQPAELKFVLIDTKKIELSLYAKIEKQFLAKMESEESAIITNVQTAIRTLNSLCMEMQHRYDLLDKAKVKTISEYKERFNQRLLDSQEGRHSLPHIVVVVDELADIIIGAGKEAETPITHLAQLGGSVGIHLIIATQRSDKKVITNLVKTSFLARIAFRVISAADSRAILDQPDATKLLGQGDMLIKINGEQTRLQCAFVDTPEIERITEFISQQYGCPSAYLLPKYATEACAEIAKKIL